MALEFAEYQACYVHHLSCFSGLRVAMLLLYDVLFSPLFQVCVDVFLTTQSYVDIASISVVPQTTGGRVGILPKTYKPC
jgi:hypothetical protein